MTVERHSRPLFVVGLGEVLLDCFPQRRVLGGAPVNVAIHADALLRRQGGKAVPATRVGDDADGRLILSELRDRGMDCKAVQVDPAHPTGRVDVKTNSGGDAHYDFLQNVAWDYLEFDESLAALARQCEAVCFGTLAQRHAASRAAIEQFLRAAPQALRLFDVNLRQQYYSPEVLRHSLNLASAAKLNTEELGVLAKLLDVEGDNANAKLANMCQRYSLDWIALTQGSEGTQLWSRGELFAGGGQRFERAAGADTVGAGDACCAGLIVGTLLGQSSARVVALANTLGAYVASQAGATPALPEIVLRQVEAT